MTVKADRAASLLTIGIEEEYFIVDPATRQLSPYGLPHVETLQYRSAASSDAIASFEHEFQLPIVESRTGICQSLSAVRLELEALRSTLIKSASDHDLLVVSAGTMPLGDWRTTRITDKPRYEEITQHYRDVVLRRLTCGCHVHVGVPDDDLAVEVLNRIQPWLPVLLALSASSPYYEAADTGYQSFRNILWAGFPVSGAPDRFESHNDYQDQIKLLVATGAILDPGHIYWDARLGTRFPTVEFRIADALTTIDEAVLQAGLCRALVASCVRDIVDGHPATIVRPGILRAATWHAARYGLDGTLIDAVNAEQVSADVLISRLFEHLNDSMTELGDQQALLSLADQVRRRGTSSHRQQDIFARTGSLQDVVDYLAFETALVGG